MYGSSDDYADYEERLKLKDKRILELETENARLNRIIVLLEKIERLETEHAEKQSRISIRC